MGRIVQKAPEASRWDAFIYAAYLGKFSYTGLSNAAAGVRKRGLRKVIDEMRQYPWMLSMLKADLSLYDNYTLGRTGLYREANAMVLGSLMETFNELMKGFLDNPQKTVMHENAVPPEIFYAMGLTPWPTEIAGSFLSAYDSKKTEAYIDVAENEGIPPDICSLPKLTMGMVLEDHLPHPIALVSSNMPCDGGMSQYALIENKYKIPSLYLDVPYNFYGERATDYYVSQLKRMIAWLEENTPGRMDWERMRDICEQRNRTAELQVELLDMLRLKPAPMASEAVLSSNVAFLAHPGSPRNTRLFKRLVAMSRKNLDRGKGALSNERYRVALWNPMPPIFPALFAWLEQAYGVALIMEMLTFNRHPFIDTRNPETILRDLAQIMMQVPMARHTRGPAENFFGDLFYVYEHFDLDMLWISGHIGCKNTQALFGMLREKCRKQDIPLFILDTDLLDSRIVSPEGIRNQIEQFMETVMKAERLVS